MPIVFQIDYIIVQVGGSVTRTNRQTKARDLFSTYPLYCLINAEHWLCSGIVYGAVAQPDERGGKRRILLYQRGYIPPVSKFVRQSLQQ